MKPNLLKTTKAFYEKGEFDPNQNPAVKRALGDNVLVKPDKAAEQTSGGIYVAPELQERMSLAAETGVIVAMGDGAFRWSADRTRPFEGDKPKIGQRVHFERYAGQEIVGADGQMYRLMTDKAIGAEALD